MLKITDIQMFVEVSKDTNHLEQIWQEAKEDKIVKWFINMGYEIVDIDFDVRLEDGTQQYIITLQKGE
jgi:hypothetical protein